MLAKPLNNSTQHDRDAEFLALLAQHEPHLRACVHAMIPVWQDAEDVLQETRALLWKGFAAFRPGSNFLAWARTVARYQARARLKKGCSVAQPFSEELTDSLLAELADTPEEENRRWTAFMKCCEGLGGDAREMLRGVYVDRQKIPAIAEKLGRTLSGTYMALSRIRRRLMECVERRLQEEEA